MASDLHREVTPKGPVFTKVMVGKFAPLRPGVMVEWEVSCDHYHKDPMGPHMWRDFFIRTAAPCRHRRLTVAISEKFTAHIRRYQDAPAPAESSEHGYRVMRWEVRDAPGVKVDGMLPPVREFLPWFDISTLDSWEPVADRYRQDLIAYADTPEVKQLAAELFTGKATLAEKAEAAYRYCTRDMRYGRHPDEVHAQSARQAEVMLEDLRGDCKDKSLLLRNVLAQADIPAQLYVVSTRDEGVYDPLPPGRFNHAIVAAQIDGRTIWMDPAAGLFTYGDAPSNVQGAVAMVIDDKPSKAEPTRTPEAEPGDHGAQWQSIGRFETDGRLMFSVDAKLNGDRAAIARMMLLAEPDQEPADVLTKWLTAGRPGMTITRIDIDPHDELDGPFTYRYDAEWIGAGRSVRDMLQFKLPMRHPFLAEDAPLPAKRDYPLEGPNPQRYTDHARYKLPAGYAVTEPPESVEHATPWCDYKVTTRIEGDELVVDRDIRGLGGLVMPEQFELFREHYQTCIRSAQSEALLLPTEAVSAG